MGIGAETPSYRSWMQGGARRVLSYCGVARLGVTRFMVGMGCQMGVVSMIKGYGGNDRLCGGP